MKDILQLKISRLIFILKGITYMNDFISESLSLRLGAEFTLLRTPLFAGVEKDGEGFEVLIMPTDKIAGTGMTIAEMVADVNKLMGKDDALDAKEVEKQLSSLNPNSNVHFETISVTLCQAFLRYKSTEGNAEYAISIAVNASELLPKDMGIININKLTLSVWNTTRPFVLQRMNLTGSKALLGE